MGAALIDRIFRKTADDLLEELGYEWTYFGNKGASYEKYLGKDEQFGEPKFKIIRIEKTDEGDYICICCNKEGTAGVGHIGAWMNSAEVKACYKKIKELKRNK